MVAEIILLKLVPGLELQGLFVWNIEHFAIGRALIVDTIVLLWDAKRGLQIIYVLDLDAGLSIVHV
jgi:hypothetical protein